VLASGIHRVRFVVPGTNATRVVALRVVTTRPHFGGARAWLLCPVPRCGRRCTALYYFKDAHACRRCHRLAYSSTQESRMFDGLYRRIAGDTGFALHEVTGSRFYLRTGNTT
jgi:hypothetical protein